MTSDTTPEITEDSVRFPYGCLALVIILMVLAVFVAVRGGGFFLTLLAPPMPPLPVSATEQSHTSEYYGRDNWVYLVPEGVPNLVDFYEDEGAVCRIEPACDPERSSGQGCDQIRAVCQGQYTATAINIFWEAEIIPFMLTGEQAEVRLVRLIDFSGTGTFPDTD